ncbi:MAG: MaoC family dehydratase [Burkholderiales bacterium]
MLDNRPKYYWEDFKLGERVQLGSKQVTAEEIIEFASKYDPQPFHVDPVAAKASIFGGLIASGWHTCSMVMRMTCDSYMLQAASLGSPGVDHVKWLMPVRPGDRISAFRTTLETRVSTSRPELGIVKSLWEVFNQDGALVMTMEGYGMFGRRSPEPR